MSKIPSNMMVLTKFQVGIYLFMMWISGALAGLSVGYILWVIP